MKKKGESGQRWTIAREDTSGDSKAGHRAGTKAIPLFKVNNRGVDHLTAGPRAPSTNDDGDWRDHDRTDGWVATTMDA